MTAGHVVLALAAGIAGCWAAFFITGNFWWAAPMLALVALGFVMMATHPSPKDKLRWRR